jgi:hypothetical protein
VENSTFRSAETKRVTINLINALVPVQDCSEIKSPLK